METIAKMIKAREVKKVQYREPLDVALLLRGNRLFDTMFNAMAHINNVCLQKEKENAERIPMIMHAGVYEAYNIEYNLFIEALSLNFEDIGAREFALDFGLSAGKTKGTGAVLPIMLNGILEALRLVSVNGGVNSFSKAYYKPIVYENTITGNAAQMAAITFRHEELFRVLGNGEGVVELLESVEYFANKAFECEQKGFGGTQCREYWKKKRRPPITLYKM